MFETSLLPTRKGRDARLVRWIASGSIVLQAAAVAAFVIVPLVHPARLPAVSTAPRMTRLDFDKPPVKVIPPKPQVLRVTNQTAVSAPTRAIATATLMPRLGAESHASGPPLTDAPPLLAVGGGIGMGSPLAVGSGGDPLGSPHGANVVMARPAAPAGPLNISSGVSKGLLLSPMRPVYPAIARAAHQEGVVVVTAVIDRTGHIVNVAVQSGPAMLRQAAADAVRDARYRPYLLNGQPTEVVTTISVIFHMSGSNTEG